VLLFSKPNETTQVLVSNSKDTIVQVWKEFSNAIDRSSISSRKLLEETKQIDCSTEALQYLTEAHPVKGFHVLCTNKTPRDT
jgi:hypothetical protein